MLDLSAGHFWEPICDVDVAPLAAWMATTDARWIVQAYEDKPQRLFSLPQPLIRSLTDKVLSHFPGKPTVGDVMLSRMRPGRVHGMHHDQGEWITRVHVPLTTNHRCWLSFEDLDDGKRFHLPVGKAYTFNAARQRHAFGNEGSTERVHLLFDVIAER